MSYEQLDKQFRLCFLAGAPAAIVVEIKYDHSDTKEHQDFYIGYMPGIALLSAALAAPGPSGSAYQMHREPEAPRATEKRPPSHRHAELLFPTKDPASLPLDLPVLNIHLQVQHPRFATDTTQLHKTRLTIASTDIT